MPKINVQKPFDFAVDGLHVVTIEVGEQEVSDRCAEVAIEQLKVATLAGEEKPKAKPRAGNKE
jgi:hypothetical protein